MTDEQTKQAILGFAEFFKGITGNQDLKIPDEIAEKCGIQAQADGEYITQSAGDEIRQKNYDLMTHEEAINRLKEEIDEYTPFADKWNETRLDIKALNMAIKALEQEPRKDEIILTKEEYGELVSSEFDNGYAKGYREALEQESCEDAISRQALLDDFGFSEKTRKWGGDHSGYNTMMLYEIQDVIESQPPVKPQEKTVLYSGDGYADGYMVYNMAECPNCGYEYEDGDKDWGLSFCPNCGQKLNWESEADE